MAYQAHKNNLDEKEQEQRNNENNANTVKNAAKVAEHAGGWAAAAGKAVDVADKVTGGKSTEALGKALTKATKHMPEGKKLQDASNKLAESGLGDKIGEAADLAKGAEHGLSNKNDGLNLPGNKNEIPHHSGENKKEDKKDISKTSDSKESEDKTENTQLFKMPSRMKLLLLGSISGFVLILIPIILVVAVSTSVGDAVTDFFNNVGRSFVGFFTGETSVTEEEFYNTLDKVRNKIQKEDGVCVDINMIIAALTVDKDFDQALEEGNKELESSDGEYTKRMQKNIALLGAMQVKHQHYSLDKNATMKCKTSEEKVPVTNDNKDSFQLDWVNWWTTDDANYLVKDVALDSPRAIARNDKELNVNFFDKKVSEEKNYAYYIYYPPYDSTDNTCTDTYAKAKLKAINDDEKAVLDIGSLKNMKETVFYWNLVDQFIPYYYKDYLPKEEGAERQAAIEKIADDIYALYESMGPNQNCKKTTSTAYGFSYTINGISVSNVKIRLLDNSFNPIADEELIDIEKYITGVVNAENGYIGDAYREALKAQAIAARSYLLMRAQGFLSDYIEINGDTAILGIRNSTSDQVYCNPETGCHIDSNGVYHTGPREDGYVLKRLTESELSYLNNTIAEVTGMVLVDSSGNIIQTDYKQGDQDNWNTSSEAGVDYRTMLMETYPSATSIMSLVTSMLVEGTVIHTGNITTYTTTSTTPYNCPFFPYNNFEVTDYWNLFDSSDYTQTFVYTNGKTSYNKFWHYKIQCTWYTYGRALKMLVEDFGMSISDAKKELDSALSGHAGNWFSNNSVYSASTNVDDARPGAIIVWKDAGSYGHVGFVEAVERNTDGTIKNITTSEGNWPIPSGTTALKAANPKNPCHITTMSRDKVLSPYTNGTRSFAGYIYVVN